MKFLNSFDVGDIIGFCSLVVGVIGLIFVKPIYKHFNKEIIRRLIEDENLEDGWLYREIIESVNL